MLPMGRKVSCFWQEGVVLNVSHHSLCALFRQSGNPVVSKKIKFEAFVSRFLGKKGK